MAILIDRDITAAMKRGEIVIDPFDKRSLGTNSYDVHLGSHVHTYAELYDATGHEALPLDVKAWRPTVEDVIHSERGMVLYPARLYLASTVEYTESHKHVPFLEGKSSLGRLGLSIHVTAGKGDVGFCNHWTMEITVVQPVRVYAGMPVGQLIWHEASGEPLVGYANKPSAKYTARTSRPQASEMWRNFVGKTSG